MTVVVTPSSLLKGSVLAVMVVALLALQIQLRSKVGPALPDVAIIAIKLLGPINLVAVCASGWAFRKPFGEDIIRTAVCVVVAWTCIAASLAV